MISIRKYDCECCKQPSRNLTSVTRYEIVDGKIEYFRSFMYLCPACLKDYRSQISRYERKSK